MAGPARRSALRVSRGLAGVSTVSPAPPSLGHALARRTGIYYALEE